MLTEQPLDHGPIIGQLLAELCGVIWAAGHKCKANVLKHQGNQIMI